VLQLSVCAGRGRSGVETSLPTCHNPQLERVSAFRHLCSKPMRWHGELDGVSDQEQLNGDVQEVCRVLTVKLNTCVLGPDPVAPPPGE
jgi:hypothetical protein